MNNKTITNLLLIIALLVVVFSVIFLLIMPSGPMKFLNIFLAAVLIVLGYKLVTLLEKRIRQSK